MSAENEHSHYTGLNNEEVVKSRELHGNNSLTPPKRPSLWKLYVEKFEDPVIRILLVAAVLSLIISIIENEYAETIGIIAAILLATGIGFYFEYDAARKFDILNTVNEDNPVKVLRNGSVHEVSRKEIVVGDVVLLETGDEIPADGDLLEALSLQVNESNLTGEMLVGKTNDPALFKHDATYPSNHLLRGTTVMNGHGTMLVTKVGDSTEIGKVARESTVESGEPTPLNLQLNKLAKLIGKIGFTIAGLTFLIFVVKDVYLYLSVNAISDWHGYMAIAQIVLKYFMMAVTLIVVAVPEGLPMSVTLSLALNMRRMLSTNNLVRKMHACETMGAITVICTDKTGTLTQNRMQVYQPFFDALPDGKQLTDDTTGLLIAEAISVNSTAYLESNTGEAKPKGVGNPTEVALLLWLKENSKDYLPIRETTKIIDQLAFSTERKYMATLVQSPVLGKKILYIKGAPEVILGKCDVMQNVSGTETPISESLPMWSERLLELQKMAMRTLGFAYRIVDEADTEDCVELVNAGGLIFQGIVAISDPVREEVPGAVENCYKAGIDLKIVTGDTPGTAIEIARRIGMWKSDEDASHQISGVEFAALSDEDAYNRVKDLKVMSRARPTDKQRLVQLLQKRGEVVAVTGDGTNDAPALNYAHVGLSMGSGTSVAKEASDITLLDDSFSSISTAVMWGRSLYKNIQRFIVFQLTINFVALLMVLVGAFIGSELPLTVTQMLWVNLIMDTFAALALASIPPSLSVMDEKPRKSTDFIINRRMWINIIGTGTLFLVVLMGMMFYYEHTYGEISIYQLTLIFTFFVMLQFWNLFNARVFGTTDSAFKGLSKSYGTMVVLLLIVVGQFIIVQFGGAVFRTEPLSWYDWLCTIAISSSILWIGEVIRLVRRLRK